LHLTKISALAQFDPAKRIYGVLYTSAAAFVWGFLAIFIKVSLNDVAPVVVVWFRFSVAFGIVFMYFVLKDRQKLSIIRKPPVFLILAALCLTFNYLAFAKGIQLTSPSNAQIFIQLGPMLLAVVGIIHFKERISIRQGIGFVLAGIGLALFFHDQVANLLGSEDIYISGVLWVVFSAIAWTIYASLQKKLVQKWHAQQLNVIIFGLPMLVLLPFVEFNVFSTFSTNLWILLVCLGIITIIAYGCLAEAFKYIEANKISVIVTLNPIITFTAMAVLGAMNVDWIDAEVTTIYGIFGAFIVIIGAVLVVLPKKMKAK
jgi:drug/metabolite transporter (DMT)-like permease